jgi:hypothetical protein
LERWQFSFSYHVQTGSYPMGIVSPFSKDEVVAALSSSLTTIRSRGPKCVWSFTFIPWELSPYSAGYGLDGRGSIPGMVKRFFLFSITSSQCLGPTQRPMQCIQRAVSPGVKRLGREADHSPSSSVEVRNGGAIPTLPHTSSWRSA